MEFESLGVYDGVEYFWNSEDVIKNNLPAQTFIKTENNIYQVCHYDFVTREMEKRKYNLLLEKKERDNAFLRRLRGYF